MTPPTTPDQGDERRAISAALERCQKLAIESGAYESYHAVREAFAELSALISAAPPVAQEASAFLEVPDVADEESGLYTYYSRELVLQCIDSALEHQAALAAAQPSQEAEPEWWYAECADPDYSRLYAYKADALSAISDHGGGTVTPLYAAPPQPASAEAGKGVERDAYVADLIDTFEQLRQILGTPEQDADALIAAARRLVSESVAVSGEVSDSAIIKAAGECFSDENFEFTGEVMEFARAVLALAGSGKQAAALERMARLDDEMGIEP